MLKQSLTCNAADDQVRLASFYSCIHLKQILAEMCFGGKNHLCNPWESGCVEQEHARCCGST